MFLRKSRVYDVNVMTRDEPLFKMAISLDLNILLNIWDNVSRPKQVNKRYNTVLVVFGYFNKKIYLTYCAFNH